MIFPDKRIFVCKYCGRKLEMAAGSNSARLISHLYDHHSDELEQIKDLYLADIVKEAYESKGEAK